MLQEASWIIGILYCELHASDSLTAGSKICDLMIFSNSLDPDQDRQSVGPDLEPNSFDILIEFLKEFLKENIFFKKSADRKKIRKVYKACKELSVSQPE